MISSPFLETTSVPKVKKIFFALGWYGKRRKTYKCSLILRFVHLWGSFILAFTIEIHTGREIDEGIILNMPEHIPGTANLENESLQPRKWVAKPCFFFCKFKAFPIFKTPNTMSKGFVEPRVFMRVSPAHFGCGSTCMAGVWNGLVKLGGVQRKAKNCNGGRTVCLAVSFAL